MNGIAVCLEEIALEGLDGITISTLWKRLNSVTSRLVSTLDDSYKSFLWKSILSSENVGTFLLENPREELDLSSGDEKIYPFCRINDEASGQRGSCSSFYSRKPVDASIENLDDVEQKYGGRLVLVASQILREKVLFGQEGHPFVEITEDVFFLLEWVGRARRLGRLQSASSPFNGIENRTNFHYIKVLQRLQFITKQPVLVGGSRTGILYLSKFHVEHCRDPLPFKICCMVETMSNENFSMEDLCSHFNEPNESVKEIVEKLYKTGHIQLLDVAESPDGSSKDHEGHQVKNVIKLITPFFTAGNEEEEEEEEEEEMVSVGKQGLSLKLHAEIPISNGIYQLVESKGIKGITLCELIKDVGLPFYDIRAATVHLESTQKVTVIFEDVGRSRVKRFIATKILKQHRNLTGEAHQEEKNAEPEEPKDDPSTTQIKAGNPCPSVSICEATKDDSLGFTEKCRKRRNIIVDFLSREKVAVGHIELRKFIIGKEAENGYFETIDRRTLVRFLDKLKEFGIIQIFNVPVEMGEDSHTLSLLCEYSVQEEDPEVLAAISKYKERYEDALKKKKVQESAQNKEINQLSLSNVLGYNTKLGYLPKMPRCEMLHVFLFYLIYELAKPDVDIKAWRQKFEWAEHLTPEHAMKEFGEGLFTAASIIMLLPLSLYVKVIGISFQVDVIDQYIKDPATKHMLLKDLPAVERYYLTYRQRHFPHLLGGLQVLADMNIITPTTKIPFQYAKDIACHLNRTAVLKDTRQCLSHYDKASHPDGEEFPETVFPLASLLDVEQYWSMAKIICLTTPLGARSTQPSVKKRRRTNLREFLKDEENMHTSIKPHGDGLGAAGFDSRSYCHLNRNWTWITGKPVPASSKDTTIVLSVDSDQDVMFNAVTVHAGSVSKHTGGKGIKRKCSQPVKDENVVKKSKLSNKDVQTGEASHQRSLDSEVNRGFVNKKRQASKKKKASKMRSNAKKVKKRSHWTVKHHDQRDIEAAKQKEVLRVTFTAQEQKLLFICVLALRILGKKSTDTCYSDWLWIRDILYKQNYELAKTKTALSISRKHRTMMKDPKTKVNLNICTADCVQEKEFHPYCNLAKSCDEKSFNTLVELLKKKYSVESTETRPLCLPHNMKTIQKRNNFQSGLQPKNPEKADKDIISLKAPITCLARIRHGVIRDSIISALLLVNEKYDPNDAYSFLDQFVEEELFLVIRELKKKHLITQRTACHAKGKNLAVAAFRQCFSTIGQRVLDAHLPSSVIDEAVSFYHQLQHGCPHSREHPHTGSVQKPANSQSFTLLEDSMLGGHVACILSLLATGKLSVEMEVPENSLRVEFADKNTANQRQANQDENKKHDTPVVSQADPQQTTRAKKVQEETGREPLLIDSRADANVNENRTSAEASCVNSKAKESDKEIDNRLVEQTSGDGANSSTKTAGNKRTPLNSNNLKKIGETPHGSGCPYPKRSEARQAPPFLDVLSGIEDHLFGSCDESHNLRMHKVSLQSKPTFTCHLITPHGDSIAHAAGDLLSNIRRNVDSHANVSSDHYNHTILLSRNAGSNIKPTIKTNPCSIKLSLLSSPVEVPNPSKSHGILEHIVEQSQVNSQTVPEKLEECKSVCSKEFGFTERDCLSLTAVYQNIESSSEIGLSFSDVAEMIKQQGFLSKVSIERLIDVLKASNLVSEVGFVDVRFVSCNFKHHWSLPVLPRKVSKVSTETSPNVEPKCGTQTDSTLNMNNVNCKPSVSGVVKCNSSTGTCIKSSLDNHEEEDELLLQNDETLICDQAPENASGLETIPKPSGNAAEEKQTSTKVCVQQSGPISRPWFCMGGEINKKAYNTLHKSVLCYIMRYPGVQEFTIAKHFVNLIYPVTVHGILQTLEESHCIQKRFVYKKTTSLFSSSRACTRDFVEEDKVTYFLPTGDAVTQFINHVIL